jgi:hypothetical protein
MPAWGFKYSFAGDHFIIKTVMEFSRLTAGSPDEHEGGSIYV